MATKVGKLTALKVERETRPGLHGDGRGLYLRVSATGTKGWIARYQLDGRRRDLGLGAYPAVTLAHARVKADDARRMVADGRDPVVAKEEERRQRRLADTRGTTFDQCVTRFLASYGHGWRNAKHRDQWKNTLATYCSPVFGSLSVQDIETTHVMRVLETLWHAKPETASRVRQRIERVLAWAAIQGLRDRANPAQWKNHLSFLLPSRAKVRGVKHHAAMPYDKVPSFMRELSARDGLAALALQFVILTAARTGEAVGATWGEIDLDSNVWTVPAERMKSGRAHRVPLSPEVVELLRTISEFRESDDATAWVFPGVRGKPLSNMALLMLLRRMGLEVTSHGFRSSFRDWAAERTAFPREAIEASLAHTLGSKTEVAYLRSDLFERRRKLMDEWSAYCVRGESATGEVVPIRREREEAS